MSKKEPYFNTPKAVKGFYKDALSPTYVRYLKLSKTPVIVKFGDDAPEIKESGHEGWDDQICYVVFVDNSEYTLAMSRYMARCFGKFCQMHDIDFQDSNQLMKQDFEMSKQGRGNQTRYLFGLQSTL